MTEGAGRAVGSGAVPTTSSNVVVVAHPLVRDKVTRLRNRSTPSKRFRELVTEIAMLMTFRVTQDLEEEAVTVETPLETAQGTQVHEENVVVVPILRAGLGMMDGVLRVVPGARVGHVGFERDEDTLEAKRYYAKLPSGAEHATHFLVDPMVGTGGSASAAVDWLKERGVRDIRLLCLLASPEGLARLQGDHPGLVVYAAAVDRQLSSAGYLLPGLGDAGDRMFGTLFA